MVKKRTPAPETFARPEPTVVITYRLTKSDAAALMRLAKRAKVGHSTLTSRVMENYIQEHAEPRASRG